MKRTNALQMRRNLGLVLRQLDEDGKPVLVERNREPAAVLISIKDFEERFVDVVAAEDRRRLVDEIRAMRSRSRRARKPTVAMLRELRGPLP